MLHTFKSIVSGCFGETGRGGGGLKQGGGSVSSETLVPLVSLVLCLELHGVDPVVHLGLRGAAPDDDNTLGSPANGCQRLSRGAAESTQDGGVCRERPGGFNAPSQ
jgi:hypothetical protein